MSDRGPRADALAAGLPELGVDLLLVSEPANLRYLTGFTGSNGMAVLGADGAGIPGRLFLTDFRYAVQAPEQLGGDWEVRVGGVDLIDFLAAQLGPGPAGRLGFDDAHLTVARHKRLAEQLGSLWPLVPCGGAVERMRSVKEPAEVERIAAAASLADDVLHWLVEGRSVVGRTERDLAIELEVEMRRRGARRSSFPTIVAAGAHGALAHAEPRDVPIPPDTLLVVDMGAELDGYCSDVTRTFATGRLGEQERAVYALVLDAQERALLALSPGMSGVEADAVARRTIEQGGHGEHFGHGLGHGVGLEVHEAPRLSRSAGPDPLLAGNVVTVEPGIYLPGRFGVRIEDLVVLEGEGARRLSQFPKDLIDVG